MFNSGLELFKRSDLSLWTDPYISKNMLSAQLDGSSDAASRNNETMNTIVSWIVKQIPAKSKVLDLGCGPGLYASALAKLGYEVTGIDCNPVSIDYAVKRDLEEKTGIRYHCSDYLKDDIGDRYDAVIMIYCDFGALIPAEQRMLFEKVRHCVVRGGLFIFDVFGEGYLSSKIEKRDWIFSNGNDFWSETPYLLLQETKHFPEKKACGSRYILIDERSKSRKEFILWDQYYEDADIKEMIEQNGFTVESLARGLISKNSFASDDVIFIRCRN